MDLIDVVLARAMSKSSGGGISASDAIPLANGEASAGTSLQYSRGDHVHPSDESKADIKSVQDIESMIATMQIVTYDYSEFTSYDLISENNSLYYFNELTELKLTISSDVNIEDAGELFECSILFTSGSTATNLDYSASPIIWSGDDCDSDGHFVPESNKTYEISIKKFGLIISARVGVI